MHIQRNAAAVVVARSSLSLIDRTVSEPAHAGLRPQLQTVSKRIIEVLASTAMEESAVSCPMLALAAPAPPKTAASTKTKPARRLSFLADICRS
jgi:hypothetical protein